MMPASMMLATLVAVLGGEPEDADVIAERVGPMPGHLGASGRILEVAQEVVGEGKARRAGLRYGRAEPSAPATADPWGGATLRSVGGRPVEWRPGLHELIAHPGHGDPVCACGWNPADDRTATRAATVHEAADQVLAHVRARRAD